MKRFACILMAGLLLLPACTKEIRTETLSLKEDIPFHEGNDDNTLSLALDIDFPVSGFPKEALETVRRTIRIHTLGEAYADFTGPLAKLGELYTERATEDYRTSNESMLQDLEMSEEDAPFIHWESEYKGAFGESWDKYVNYMVDLYDYMGGAHGMFGTLPLVFNRETGEAVTWHDVAPGVSDEKMDRLVNKHKYDDLRDTLEDAEIDEESIFFSETIETSSSFTVSENGLTFYYQPYDIAPYVFGVITIPVPWEELR